eukprot:COSAG01_NODE_8157_length_2898_cov_1.780993_3_plen_65_part_01
MLAGSTEPRLREALSSGKPKRKMVRHNNQVPNRHFHKDWQVRPSAHALRPALVRPPRACGAAKKA